MSDEENFEDTLEKITDRRKKRDDYYLRQGKIVATRELAAHWKEWIAAENKDLLIITNKLKGSSDKVLSETANDVGNRVTKINKTFTRTIITPLNKIANGGSKAKSEMEHMEKFQKSVNYACNTIIELGKLRDILDDTIKSSKHESSKQKNSKDYSFYN